MSFSLTVLGSSAAVPSAKRFPTAQVLQIQGRFFLIDCGEGTQIQLRRFGINLSKINHIFISHLHGDHVFGLFGLLSSYNLISRKNDLHIHAHRDLESSLHHFRDHFGPNLSYPVVFHPFTAEQPYEIYQDRLITVETLPLRHSIPTVGFIFREKSRLLNIRKEMIPKYDLGIRDIRKIKEGHDYLTPEGVMVANRELTLPPHKRRSYAFCTDTAYFKKLIANLQHIDLLYFEATFSDKDKKLAKLTQHSTSVQAAKLALQAGVGKLLIGHFSNRYKNIEPLLEEARKIFPETYTAEDGEVHVIPDTVESATNGRE